MSAFTLIPVLEASHDLLQSLNSENFPTRFAHPVYGEVGDFFYPVIHQENWTSHSFLIVRDNSPALWVTCGDRGDRLTHFGFPIQFNWHKNVTPDRKIIQGALVHLNALKQEQKLRYIWITGDGINNQLGPLDRACLDEGGRPVARFNAVMDLSKDETDLRKGLRKSYKSLINWGKRSFNMTYLNKDNPDADLFEHFITFYNKVAGQSVHSDATWQALFQLITQGRGEISLAFDQEYQLVAGSAFIDEGGTCLYFIAAYERDRFDKPIGHWPVFNASLRAKERGNKWFDLGEFYAAGEKTEKDRSIGFFKKGFTDEHRIKMTWQL